MKKGENVSLSVWLGERVIACATATWVRTIGALHIILYLGGKVKWESINSSLI